LQVVWSNLVTTCFLLLCTFASSNLALKAHPLSDLCFLLCRAATEGASDHESPEPTKNMVELLAPFLAPPPQSTGIQPDNASAALHTAGSTATTNSSQQSLEQETHAVRHFIEQHHGNSGLYAVAVALLDLILGGETVYAVSSMTQELMDLEILVRGRVNAPAHRWTAATIHYMPDLRLAVVAFGWIPSSCFQYASVPFMCMHKLLDVSLGMQAGVVVLQCP